MLNHIYSVQKEWRIIIVFKSVLLMHEKARKLYEIWIPLVWARVCGLHFVSGRPVDYKEDMDYLSLELSVSIHDVLRVRWYNVNEAV